MLCCIQFIDENNRFSLLGLLTTQSEYGTPKISFGPQKKTRENTSHLNEVCPLKCLASNRLASGSNGDRIKIWNIDSRKCIQTLSGHSSGCMGMTHELIIIVMRSRKHFSGTLCSWIYVLRVQSRKNNSENLTIFRGEFKTENFKKIRKNEVF